jgi:2-methylaconitate cis-trans-isomerase PrpF
MGTGGICTIVAANTPGTVVNEIVCANKPDIRPRRSASATLRHHGHDADLEDLRAADTRQCGMIGRTARRLMEGYVYVRD